MRERNNFFIIFTRYVYIKEGYESDVEEPNDDISFLECLRQSPPRQTEVNMSTEDESEYEPGTTAIPILLSSSFYFYVRNYTFDGWCIIKEL